MHLGIYPALALGVVPRTEGELEEEPEVAPAELAKKTCVRHGIPAVVLVPSLTVAVTTRSVRLEHRRLPCRVAGRLQPASYPAESASLPSGTIASSLRVPYELGSP